MTEFKEVSSTIDKRLDLYDLIAMLIIPNLRPDMGLHMLLTLDEYEEFKNNYNVLIDKEDEVRLGIQVKFINQEVPDEVIDEDYLFFYEPFDKDNIILEMNPKLLFRILYSKTDYFGEDKIDEDYFKASLKNSTDLYNNAVNMTILFLHGFRDSIKTDERTLYVGINKFSDVRTFVLNNKTYPVIGVSILDLLQNLKSKSIRVFNFKTNTNDFVTDKLLASPSKFVREYVRLSTDKECDYCKMTVKAR